MTIVCPVNISTMHIVRILLIRFLAASWLPSSLSLSLRFFLHCRKSIIENLALQFVNVNCIPRIDTFDGQHDVQLTNDRIIISIDASIILSAHSPLYIHFLHAFSDKCECCSEAEKTHSDCACASVCSPHKHSHMITESSIQFQTIFNAANPLQSNRQFEPLFFPHTDAVDIVVVYRTALSTTLRIMSSCQLFSAKKKKN